MDANQGYVNQRILSTSRKKFHEQFGDQETSEHYGHFAADQFLANSPQLYAVRATMGDEAYGFIQFPYDDAAAKDCNHPTLFLRAAGAGALQPTFCSTLWLPGGLCWWGVPGGNSKVEREKSSLLLPVCPPVESASTCECHGSNTFFTLAVASPSCGSS